MFKYFFLFFFKIFFISCTNNISDSDESINVDCSVVENYYNETIAPIMAQSCNGCHSGNSPSGAVKTNNYNDVRNGIENIINRVQRDQNSSGFMPLGGEKLSNENLSVLDVFLNMECE